LSASPSDQCAAWRFASERILKEDFSAELIPKPPFVSITVAIAAMGHRDTDMQTIDEEEETRKEGVWSFLSSLSQ